MACDVADVLALDRVLWIPAGEPPHKPRGSVSPGRVRLEMVRAAVESDPRFAVETMELDRPGPSYMVDTVRALRQELSDAELFLILGVDQLRLFDTWREPGEIVRHVRLAVMDRGGESARASARGLPSAAEVVFVPVRRVDVSSTEIRERVRAGLDVWDLLPPGVHAIIERERLYSAV